MDALAQTSSGSRADLKAPRRTADVKPMGNAITTFAFRALIVFNAVELLLALERTAS